MQTVENNMYLMRSSPDKTEYVECLSETYKGFFLFINHKGDLAIGHIETGLMIADYNVITFKYGQVNRDNWKFQVDYALELTEKNIQNVKENLIGSWNHSCGLLESNYSPYGKIQDVLKKYTFNN